jgi:hypothetical protein
MKSYEYMAMILLFGGAIMVVVGGDGNMLAF